MDTNWWTSLLDSLSGVTVGQGLALIALAIVLNALLRD